MSIKQGEILGLLLILVIGVKAAPSRMLVTCDRAGFTCNMFNAKRNVVFQCPSTTQDVIIYIWNYGEPSNTAFITVKDCESVEIDMGCTSYRRSYETMTIENVKNLRFTRSQTTLKNPSRIVLRNISYVDIIPENTFTIPHMVKYSGEADQHELREIEFENVHIGTVEGHAFHSLRGFRKFAWHNVKVDRIHANAIKIDFNTTDKYEGKFAVTNSSIDIVEYLGFQIYLKEATFRNNKFVEIMPGGINGTIQTLNFLNNIVNTLQSGAISVLSKDVNILDNQFELMKAGSLERISPGLLIDSHTSFGNLEFSYRFNNNNINYMDAGCLNPDMNAYNKVATNFVFSYNTFLCTCENVAWLTTTNSHGFSSNALQDFYEIVREQGTANVCSRLSCVKTLGDIKRLLKNKNCDPDVPMEVYCQTTTTEPTTAVYSGDGVQWLNNSDDETSSSTTISLSILAIYYFIISLLLGF